MKLHEQLDQLIAAQSPLLHLVTYEEDRVVHALEANVMLRDFGLVSWDIADGFVVHRPGREPFPTKDCTTDTVLAHVAEKLPAAHVLVLKDFHQSWSAKRALISRKLRNLAPRLRATNRFFVFLTPPLPAEQALPLELKDEVVTLQVPLPDLDDLRGLFAQFTHKLDRAALPAKATQDQILQSALGLTSTQARFALATVWAQHRRFDARAIELVTRAKQQVIRESGALEFWAAYEGEADVGGLDLLKAWLQTREKAILPEAREAGLPFPRGVALIGIPGTGKSLSAKMISGLWKLPLLRLDVGSLFGSLLGESEQNLRKAIMLAETVSPAILWIDEIEKAFAGSGAGSVNSGAATRIFGTFLTWMQEHRSPVFVIATANDIEGLPPELIGRYDATFFLDLPNAEERRAIFSIHLKRAGVTFPEKSLRLDELVGSSQGMVGREIERAVREAQFAAYADENREIEQRDVAAALAATVPLSRSHQSVIEHLRKWKTEGRARPASSEEPPAATPRGRTMEI